MADLISSLLGKIQRQDGFWYVNGDQTPFLQVSHFHPSDLPIRSLGEKLDDLIGYELAGNIRRNADDVDMDDPRVRQFIEDEVKPIRFWMAMGQELEQGKSVLEVFDYVFCLDFHLDIDSAVIQRLSSDSPMVRVVHVSSKTVEKSVGKDQLVSAVKDQIANLEKGRETLKPGWLKEWEASTAQDKTGP
jgi:hypothetical protein